MVYVDGSGSTGTSGTATAITETSGPTTLTVGAVADGQFTKRSGSTFVGAAAPAPSAGSVTLAMQANLAANSIIGNNTGSPATPIALTVAQVTTMLGVSGIIDCANNFDPTVSGLDKRVGSTVGTIDGTKAWFKVGTATTDWEPIHST